jgi:hypothetical protein
LRHISLRVGENKAESKGPRITWIDANQKEKSEWKDPGIYPLFERPRVSRTLVLFLNRFCRIPFALEIIRTATTLFYLVVLLTHAPL